MEESPMDLSGTVKDPILARSMKRLAGLAVLNLLRKKQRRARKKEKKIRRVFSFFRVLQIFDKKKIKVFVSIYFYV